MVNIAGLLTLDGKESATALKLRSQAGGNKGSLDNGFESQSLAVSSGHRGHQAAFQNARKVISTPHAQQEVFILSGSAKEGA